MDTSNNGALVLFLSENLVTTKSMTSTYTSSSGLYTIDDGNPADLVISGEYGGSDAEALDDGDNLGGLYWHTS
jgi:hypothetical protein